MGYLDKEVISCIPSVKVFSHTLNKLLKYQKFAVSSLAL